MAEKQTILGRIAQLAKANINALLDRAENPQKMLDQMVRDYTNSIAEAQDAVAVTIGNLRLAQADYAEDVKDAREWGQKALAASRKADEYRIAGKGGEVAFWQDELPVAGERAGKGGERPRAQVGKGGEEGVGHGLYVMNVGRRMRI